MLRKQFNNDTIFTTEIFHGRRLVFLFLLALAINSLIISTLVDLSIYNPRRAISGEISESDSFLHDSRGTFPFDIEPIDFNASGITCLNYTCDSAAIVLDTAIQATSGSGATNTKSFTCSDLIFDNPTKKPDLYREARERTVGFQRTISNSEFLELCRDCEAFKAERGYLAENSCASSAEELRFPIAYSIVVHRDVHQVERLLRSIYRPQNVYCLHIDAGANASVHTALGAISNCFPNVFIASKLERVVYAGFSRLKADINCMRDLLASGFRWRYLINLAGQAFPLKTNAELVEILKIYNGSNDIEGVYKKRQLLSRRYTRRWTEKDVDTDHPSVVQVAGRADPPPHNLVIVKGSAYGVFSRAFVRFALEDQVAVALLEWCRGTQTPDEHFWATLHHTYANPHLRTPGGFTGHPDEKPWLASYSAWSDLKQPCHGRWQRWYCVFGIEDLPQLVRRHELFVNKLEASYQPLALDCLEAYIRQKSSCSRLMPIMTSFAKVDYNYYKSLPFVRR